MRNECRICVRAGYTVVRRHRNFCRQLKRFETAADVVVGELSRDIRALIVLEYAACICMPSDCWVVEWKYDMKEWKVCRCEGVSHIAVRFVASVWGGLVAEMVYPVMEQAMISCLSKFISERSVV